MTQLLISARPNYLNPSDRLLIDHPVGDSLGGIADALCITPEARACLIVQMDGHVIPSNMWDHVWPKAGVRVEVFPAYRGGSSGKSIMAMVAMLALSALTFGVGGYMGLAYVVGGSYGSLAVAAVGGGMMLLGGLAIGALFAPPDQDVSDPGKGQLLLTGQSNRPRPDDGMMRVYGEIRVAPDVIALPYPLSHDGDEHLLTIYSFGYGGTAFDDLWIGPVHYTNLDEVDKMTRFNWTPADGFKFYHHDVHHEALDIRLINQLDTKGGEKQPPDDDFRVFKTEKATDSVVLSVIYPEGVFLTLTSGGSDSIRVVTWIFYRVIGTTAWINASTLTNTLDSPKGRASWVVVDGDMGIGFNYELAKTFLSQASFDMPSRGQYEFKIGRSQDPNSRDKDPQENWHCQSHVRYLQSITHEPPIAPQVPISYLELKVKATDQISGTVDNMTGMARTYIPYMENGAWLVPTHSGHSAGVWSHPWTNNPAWIFLDILKGDTNKKPLVDDDIDLDAFIKWAAYCEQPSPDDAAKPFIACNFVHTGYETVDQILQKVAACGNASRHIRDGKHSIIWDAEAPHAVQIFTQRNASNFQFTKNFIELPHGIKVKFKNEENDFKEEVVIAYSPGHDATSASTFEEMDAFGSTEINQSKRAGLRYLAMGRYRFEEFSYTADIENLACERGDRVKVSFESVKEGGITGRVMKLATDASGSVTSITLDQKHGFTIAAGVHLGFMVRGVDSTVTPGVPFLEVEAVDALPGDYELQLSTPLANPKIAVGDLCVFGEMEEIIDDYLIMNVTPGADLTAGMLATPYAPELQLTKNGGTVTGDVPPT